MRLSEMVDAGAVAAIAAGLGLRFGWWLSATSAGLMVILANWARAR